MTTRALNFVRSLSIVDKSGKLLTLNLLHDEQLNTLEVLLNGKSLIILKGRQIGSSTICLAYLFYRLFFSKEPITCIILSHKQASSKLLLDKMKTFYKGLPKAVQRAHPAVLTATSLVFKNTGASAIARGARDKAGIRSSTCNYLLLSEFAFAENPEELLAEALSALGDGQLIIESTASHYGDALHKEIEKVPNTGYQFLFYPFTAHQQYEEEPEPNQAPTKEEVDLTPRQIAFRRKQVFRLGRAKAIREYPRSIEEAYAQLAGSLLSDEALGYLTKRPCEDSHVSRYEAPQPDTRYVIGVDTGMGIEQDYSSLHVLNCRTMELAAHYHSNQVKTPAFADIVALLSSEYQVDGDKAQCNVEENNCGLAVIQSLEDQRIPIQYVDGRAHNTNTRTKPLMIDALHRSITNRELKSVDDWTYSQLRSVRLDNYGKLDIPKGSQHHFDGGISLILAIQASSLVSLPVPKKELPKGPYVLLKKRRY